MWPQPGRKCREAAGLDDYAQPTIEGLRDVWFTLETAHPWLTCSFGLVYNFKCFPCSHAIFPYAKSLKVVPLYGEVIGRNSYYSTGLTAYWFAPMMPVDWFLRPLNAMNDNNSLACPGSRHSTTLL